jgi:hypothetical protein
MHDLDRTLGRTQMESGPFEFTGEQETFGEFQPEFQGEFQGEFPGEFQGEQQEVFHETELQELAAELLSVSNEQELNHFLGSLIKRAGSALGKVVRSPIGQALGGVLKTVAKQALPLAGSALGNLVLPGVGGMIGGKLASAAGSMFGLELEGLSQEDREFEVAKQFVRLATDATRAAVNAPPSANPSAIVQNAVAQAAQKFAPGLLSGTNAAAYAGGGMSGRWVRRGRRIVIYGV